MANHQSLGRALHIFWLTSCLQVVSTAPVRSPDANQGANEALGSKHPPVRRAPPPQDRSINGIDYSTASYPPNQDTWTATIYEIGDGQVQEPHTIFTGDVLVTTSGSTFESKVTSFYGYTPSTFDGPTSRPNTAASGTSDSTASLASRENAVPSTSTSYTTIFVQPTPASVTSNQATESSTLTSVPENSLTSLTTSEVQTVTASAPLNTTGAVQTTLERSGEPSSVPFATVSLGASTGLSLVNTATLSGVGPTATQAVTSISAPNIFQLIATGPPPPQISSRGDHPVPRLGIQQQQQRLETNKFYANFFLGDQTAPTWTHPYSVSWSVGEGETDSWGLAISHTEPDQWATGAKTSQDAGEWAFFANPVGIQSLVLSDVGLSNGTTLTTDTLEAFSVNVNLIPAGGSVPTITFPLVQGMGFVTGVYNDGEPLIQSGIGIQNVTYAGAVLDNTTFKYRTLLSDSSTWLIYVTPMNPNYQENSFTLISPVAIQGPLGFGGYIQIAKVPAGTSDAENIYDGSAGAYATAVNITGSVEGTAGTYSFLRTKAGAAEQPLLMFALPHHLSSFNSATLAGVTDVQLQTTTKGMATAVQADSWTIIEPELPIDMSFSPWSPSQGSIQDLPIDVIEALVVAGTAELSQNISAQTNTGSLYYDGKSLAKFAAIVYVLQDMAHNITLAMTGLEALEQAFDLHVNNLMTWPLVYDTCWGGVISISTYITGNSGDDFGNTYYNDHHFHFGYFMYAAAVIGYLDPSWLESGTNKDWVNMLARDYANSIVDDPYTPFSRSFDWYMGHSWAKGLFESFDGKDEESSSEDTMASYGLKMWGKTVGDQNMEARGNLMLAIQARSLSDYFLYMDDNTVEPAEYIGNKVSGILFENKIDHVTYFGDEVEYIEGIHMLPLMPMSTLVRKQEFVQQEWDAYNFTSYVETLDDGWRGILMANLAIIDPVTSYNFFSNASGDFTWAMLDGGASQTWYLAWSAALGGGSNSGN